MQKSIIFSKFFGAVAVIACMSVIDANAGTLYVKLGATGNGSGSSWENGFKTIQAAVSAAQADDEIWIAQGVYRFTSTEQVLIGKKLSLYGGFKGDDIGETIATRDFDAHQTIITGEPLTTTNYWKHAVPNFDNYSETVTNTTIPLIVNGKANIPMQFANAYDYYYFDGTSNGGKKVVEVASGITAVIDGIWFVGCYGNGNGLSVVHFTSAGAGSATRNLRFVGCFNNDHNTGMLSTFGGSPLYVEGCKFYYTRNSIGHGSAFYQANCNAVLADCKFFGVSRAICGSIIENRGGTLNATDLVATRCVSVTAYANMAYGAECLLFSTAGTSAILVDGLVMTNCGSLITGTSSDTAVPIIRRNGNYTIRNAYFGGNRMQFPIKAYKTYAMFMAGEDASEGSTAGQFVNVTFENNVVKARPQPGVAGSSAIGIVGGPNTPQTLVNCTFIGNEAYGFEGDLMCYASKGIINTTLLNPAKNAIGVANTTFVGDSSAPDILLLNPKTDGFVNVVNSIFKDSANDDESGKIRIIPGKAPKPLNLVNSSVNGLDVIPTEIAATAIEADPVLFSREAKTLAVGSLPVLRPASRSSGVTNAADVATLSYGFAFRTDASAPWIRLDASSTTALTASGPISDALDATRTYGAFTRGAVQGLTAAAQAGSSVVVRKMPRSGGTVAPVVQVVAPGGGISDITATPDTVQGNSFIGWYGDAAGAQLLSAANPLTSAELAATTDTVVYAKFGTPSYYITFDFGPYATFDDTGLNTKTLHLEAGTLLVVPAFTMNAGYFDEGFTTAVPDYVPYADTTYTKKAVSKNIRVLHVAANGSGDGSSWGNATSDIQAAIDEAGRFRGEVWIKAGTYIPPVYGFTMRSNVEIVGGFAGDETSRDQASPAVNRVIFSGDGGTADYWQVLNATYSGWSNLLPQQNVWVDGQFNFSEAMLDQFGWLNPFNVQGTDIDVGFYLNTCTNTAFSGVTFTLFKYQAIQDLRGGCGLLKVDNCEFLAPVTQSYAERIAISLTKAGTWIELKNSRFVACKTAVLLNTGSSTATNIVRNCSFLGGFASAGASACIQIGGSGTSFIIEDCIFRRNGSLSAGAVAMRIENSDNVDVGRVRNCVFEDNVAYSTAHGLISAGGNAAVVGPDGAFRIENCRFTGNRYDGLKNSEENAFSAVFANRQSKTFNFDACYFAGNTVLVTNGTAAATFGTVAAAHSAYDNICATLFVNCTFENNAVSAFQPAAGSKAKAGIFGMGLNGRMGLAHCMVTGSVLPSGIPEIVNRKQYQNKQIYIVNSVMKNDAVSYVPYEAVLTSLTSYTPGVMNSAISGIDPVALGWIDTSYAIISGLTSTPDGLRASLSKSADGSIWARGIASSSPYARSGRLVVRHSNGLYYVHVPELSAASPWRRIDSGADALAAAAIDIKTVTPVADALGQERTAGRIAYGPLNVNSSGLLFYLK